MRTRNNMRIILYNPAGYGGHIHYTYQLAESLARVGSDVTVITSEDYELKHLKRSFKIYTPFTKSWVKSFLSGVLSQLQGKNKISTNISYNLNVNSSLKDEEQIEISTLQVIRLYLIWLKISLFCLLRNPHIIHFQCFLERKHDFYFMKFLKFLRFNIIYTAHELLPHDSNSFRDQNIYKKIYQIPDKIIVHSENDKREIVCKFQVDLDKVSVIPHGSYDLFYRDKNITKDVAKQKLGIPDGKKVILFFGLIRRYKGLEYLVYAFQRIKEELDSTVLFIVGSIYDENSEDFKFYSDLIDLISHDDDVIRVNEYVPFEKINSYFLASDLVVLPYIKTYTSGVLLAAYAAGRPVIVTDTGALSEVVDVGKSGFIVPPKDINALACAIIKTLSDPDQMEKMGNYAKHLSKTVYSWDNIALKTINVYQSLC